MGSTIVRGSAVLLLLCACRTEPNGTISTGSETTTDDETATTIPLPTITEGTHSGGTTTSTDGTSSSTGGTETTSSSGTPETTSSSGGDTSSSSDGGPTTYDIGWCVLQYPPSVAVGEGEAFTVYIRLFAAGLTDLSGVTDPAPELVVELGYGMDGSDPSQGPDAWTFGPAVPNPGYGPGAPRYAAANDEYWGDVTIDAFGLYDYAGRVSGDGGTTWVYCDIDGLTTGGYTPDQAGSAEVCQGDGETCSNGEPCCGGLQCCSGVPVPPGGEYCAAMCP